MNTKAILSFSFRAVLALLTAAMASGCAEHCALIRYFLEPGTNASVGIELQGAGFLPGGQSQSRGEAGEVAAAVPLPGVQERVVFHAMKDVDHSFYSFPNKSYGKFIAQATVSTASLSGLTDGQSLGLIEFRQALAADGPRRFYIGAVYDAADDGLRAVVADPESGTEFGTSIAFNGKYQIDVRIEQTDTQLIFSARQTPADQSAGGWMPVYTTDLALDPAFFHVYIGVRNVGKHGAFAFTHFAIDGDAIGGKKEYPIIDELRTAVDSLRSAQAKIAAATPDLNGAENDLDAALAQTDQASTDLQQMRFSLQSPDLAPIALSSLTKAETALMAAITAVEAQDLGKAKAQLAKLDRAVAEEEQAMGNLLGWLVPRLKVAPTVFSLRIP